MSDQQILPPYDEWRTLPPEEAARLLAKHRNLDGDTERMLAAILGYFTEDKKNHEHTAN